jgi:hypothetical protein
VEEYGDLDVGSMHVSDFLGFQISRNPNSFTAKLPSVSVSNNASEIDLDTDQGLIALLSHS